MEESLRRKSGSWQIITIFEETERKMEESLRRKSGRWQRLVQYLRRQSGRWKRV
jgi:hypothetical protein